MKQKITFILMLVLFSFSINAQTQLYLVDFETASGYTTSVAEFSDGGGDYFIRTDGADIGTWMNFTGIQGTSYFAVQDTDGDGQPANLSLNLTGINIAGYSNLQFRVYLAEDQSSDGNEDWDADTYMHITGSIDGGAAQDLIWVEAESGTNTLPRIDTDFDGLGDGAEITPAFTQFTANITGTGSLLDIAFEFNALTAGDEDIAIDYIEIYALSSFDQTSTVIAPTTQLTAGTLSSINIDSVPVIQFVIQDAASGDGLPTNVTGIFLNAGPNNTISFNNLGGGGVYNITSASVIALTGQPAVTPNTVYLPVALTIPDGGSVTVEGYVYVDNLNAADGDVLQFQVNAAAHGFTSDVTGSNFESTFAGGDIVGNNFTVDVVATQFTFLTQPNNVIVNDIMSNVVVGTTDVYGNVDVDFPQTYIQVLFSGTGLMTGTNGLSTTNGICTYTNLVFDTEQTAVSLSAHDGNGTAGFADVPSNTFDITAPPSGGSTCATAVLITAGTHQAIHTVNNDYDQWYSFVATVTGTATVENCASDVDAYVAIDRGTCGTGYDLQEDACGTGGLSVNLTFNITQGETYFIGFGNWDQATTPNYDWTLTESDVTPVNSIASLRAGTIGLKYELTSEAVLTYQQLYRNQKFIQDATGAILIDDNSGIITTAYNRYDGITGITGVLSEYNGMLQFVPNADPGPATSTSNTITPQVITLAQFNANFESYEAELIKVENITFADAGGTFANGIVYSVSDASKASASFRTNFYDVDYTGGTIPGNVNVTGLCIDKGTAGDGYTFTARDLADFEVILATDATLSDLTVDGTTVTGFISSTLTYNVELPYGTTTVPAVVGTPTDANANAVTTDATGLPGSSTVLVTAEDGTTTQTYTINFTVAATGINELSADVLIYPNPSNGAFNIKSDGNFNLEISDITGKIIKTENISGNSTVQLNTKGVYFIKFSNESGSFTQRVIVQ